MSVDRVIWGCTLTSEPDGVALGGVEFYRAALFPLLQGIQVFLDFRHVLWIFDCDIGGSRQRRVWLRSLRGSAGRLYKPGRTVDLKLSPVGLLMLL